LWNQPEEGFKSVELAFSIDEESIRNYIENDLKIRYEKPAVDAKSIQGTTEFQPGLSGRSIDREKLFNDLIEAFVSPTSREVAARFAETSISFPDLSVIEGKLEEIISNSGFTGLTAIYLQPLPGNELINFAVQNNVEIDPNIAFTAASTMKIPIMVSTFWRENLPLPDIVEGWLNHMLIFSQNAPADRLMENIDPVRGPLIVTEDLRLLGLDNTFIAGYFYLGSPLLELYQTTANSRKDIDLDPDLYSQTTSQETGKLLSDIYICGMTGSGLMVEKTDGSITGEECQMMIDILSQNQIGALIEAGLPEGTQIAHKHGWSEEQDGLLHTVSDAAIVFGPEKDFVFTIFVYSPNQLLFDEANFLIAKLAQAAFNGLNPDHQIPWIFDYQ
jgi:beta-lactamase class A